MQEYNGGGDGGNGHGKFLLFKLQRGPQEGQKKSIAEQNGASFPCLAPAKEVGFQLWTPSHHLDFYEPSADNLTGQLRLYLMRDHIFLFITWVFS